MDAARDDSGSKGLDMTDTRGTNVLNKGIRGISKTEKKDKKRSVERESEGGL